MYLFLVRLKYSCLVVLSPPVTALHALRFNAVQVALLITIVLNFLLACEKYLILEIFHNNGICPNENRIDTTFGFRHIFCVL